MRAHPHINDSLKSFIAIVISISVKKAAGSTYCSHHDADIQCVKVVSTDFRSGAASLDCSLIVRCSVQ